MKKFLLLSVLCVCLAVACCGADASDPIDYPPAADWIGSSPYLRFGYSVAAYGNELIIGSSNSSTNLGPNGDQRLGAIGFGTISVYQRHANGDFDTEPIYTYGETEPYSNYWAQNPDGGPAARGGFGNAVAIGASNLIVGSQRTDKAYNIIRMSHGAWPSNPGELANFQQLSPPSQTLMRAFDEPSATNPKVNVSSNSDSYFGCQVSVSSNTVAVSACRFSYVPGDGGTAINNAGAVYLYDLSDANAGSAGFRKNSETFEKNLPQAILAPSISHYTDSSILSIQAFGTSLGMTDYAIAVGAPINRANDDAGCVFIYLRKRDSSGVWRWNTDFAQKLQGGRAHGRFGYSIDMNLNSLIVGDYVEYACPVVESTVDCIETGEMSDFQGEVIVWNYSIDAAKNTVNLFGELNIVGDRSKQSFGLSVSLGGDGTRFVVGGNDDSAWVYGTADDGKWSNTLIAKQIGMGGGYGSTVLAGSDYVLVSAPDRYGPEVGDIDNGHVYVYRIFESSGLNITVIFGITVLGITAFCFLYLCQRYYSAPAGDRPVADAKLAAKAARLGFDHPNIRNKDFNRRKGDKKKPPKKNRQSQNPYKAGNQRSPYDNL